MNEKFNIQELINELAKEQKITKKEAEIFLRNLFNVVSEGILQDKIVKIKNFGSFKVTEVSVRESIDVNTGERVMIPAHRKISYNPDANLSESINQIHENFQDSGIFEEHKENDITDSLIQSSPNSNTEKEKKKNVEESFVPPVEVEKKLMDESKPIVSEKPVIIPIAPSKFPPPKMYRPKDVKPFSRQHPLLTAFIFLFIVLFSLWGVYVFITRSNKKEYITTLKEVAERSRREQLQNSKNIVVDTVPRSDSIQSNVIIPENEVKESLEILSEQKKEGEKENTQNHDNSLEKEKKTKETLEKQQNIEVKSLTIQKQPENIVASPKNEQTPGGKKIKVNSGETLRSIALREYGDKALWEYLYNANKDVIKDPNNVYPGTTLVVPDIKTEGNKK